MEENETNKNMSEETLKMSQLNKWVLDNNRTPLNKAQAEMRPVICMALYGGNICL